MMLPYIDALHVMGYAETGSKSAGWRSYDFLKAATGNYSSKLLLGVPSHKSHWQNKSVEEHLEWVVKDKSVGLAIWDAQLKDTKWRTREVWQTISRIKQGSVLKEINAHSLNDEVQLDVRSGTSQIYLNRY